MDKKMDEAFKIATIGWAISVILILASLILHILFNADGMTCALVFFIGLAEGIIVHLCGMFWSI